MPSVVASGISVALLLPLAASASGSLTIIHDGAGITGPQATAIAGDGSRVAGSDVFLNGWQWSEAGGLEPLPGLPGDGRAVVEDLSGDGSAAVGQARTAAGWEAFLHTDLGGSQPLGTLAPDPQSVAYAVSSDGSFVVGRSNDVAFGWTLAGGMLPLSGAIGSSSTPLGMSADGSLVAGSVVGVGLSGAFRWSPAGGMVDLGAPPGYESSSAGPVSADGSAIAGSTYDADTDSADVFRWTAAGGPIALGRCAGSQSANPSDVSGDAGVIVGDCWSQDAGGSPIRTAFVWTEGGGIQPFLDYLGARGIDGSGLSIPVVTGVSDDGRVFSGYDEDPADIRAFVVRIDAPVSVPLPAPWAWLLALLLVVTAPRRRTH